MGHCAAPSCAVPSCAVAAAVALLDGPDPGQAGVQCGREIPVRRGCVGRIGHGDEMGDVPVAAQQLFQLGLGHTGQNRGVGDLVAVQVQDGQHGAVGRRVQEVVRMPAGGQRPGLGFAVTDDDGGDQVRVVEDGPIRVCQRVAELAAFADRTGGLRGGVAWNAAGVGELPEQLGQAGFVVADVAVNLRIGALQPGVGDHRGAAMAGTGDEQHLLAVPADGPVQVGIDKIQSGCGPPVTKEPGLCVFRAEGFAQQRIGPEVDLPHRDSSSPPATSGPPGPGPRRPGSRAVQDRIVQGRAVGRRLCRGWSFRSLSCHCSLGSSLRWVLRRHIWSIATRPADGTQPRSVTGRRQLAPQVPAGSVSSRMFTLTINQTDSRRDGDRVPQLLKDLRHIPARLDFDRSVEDEVQGHPGLSASGGGSGHDRPAQRQLVRGHWRRARSMNPCRTRSRTPPGTG